VNPISDEALARKTRSEDVLRLQGVRINSNLPVIEATSEIRLRSLSETAYRTLALLTVALKGEGLEPSILEKIVKSYGLEGHFTPKESAFLGIAAPSEADRAVFTWRYESASVLLWALGYIEALGKPSTICDVPRAVTIMKERSAEQFISDAKLRSVARILDEADLIYRYHWAVVDARLNGKPSPPEVDPDITYERHYALNWLIGYMDQEWDHISTDT
jgi:Domain of unknown function (DUF4272)